MKTLVFYKNQILIDRSAGTHLKQIVHCPNCHVRLVIRADKKAVQCAACGTSRKVGEADGHFKRRLPDGTTEYRV